MFEKHRQKANQAQHQQNPAPQTFVFMKWHCYVSTVFALISNCLTLLPFPFLPSLSLPFLRPPLLLPLPLMLVCTQRKMRNMIYASFMADQLTITGTSIFPLQCKVFFPGISWTAYTTMEWPQEASCKGSLAHSRNQELL